MLFNNIVRYQILLREKESGMPIITKFFESREGEPMAYIDGKISFPNRYGVKPKVGEIWEVEISGQNPKGNINYLKMIRRVRMLEWTWNDGLATRSRNPACIVFDREGNGYRFVGQDIPGIAKVTKRVFEKNGKWSNTTYHVISPEGTEIYSWHQSWNESLYWPQGSWEEAFAAVQKEAPNADPAAIEAIIRQHWGKAAAKFDENRQAMISFS